MQLDSIVKKEGSWMVKAKDGSEGVFDSVVLTIPVPQLFLLQGDMPSILSKYLGGSRRSAERSNSLLVQSFRRNPVAQQY